MFLMLAFFYRSSSGRINSQHHTTSLCAKIKQLTISLGLQTSVKKLLDKKTTRRTTCPNNCEWRSQPQAHQAPEVISTHSILYLCNVSLISNEDGSREVGLVASDPDFEITIEQQSHTDQIGLVGLVGLHHAA